MTRPAPHRHRSEHGYVAVLVAILFSSLMLAVAAVGVDTARWYLEGQRIQKAADSAALAGVVYLPDNLGQARLTALASAKLNGYDDALPEVVVTVSYGPLRSQLKVVITSTVANQFGTAIGVPRTTVTREAISDYTSPAPMGSPCNVFGNEPPGGNNMTTGTGASGPRNSQIPSRYGSTCSSQPNFWAAIQGPEADKQNGDRYGTNPCTLTPTPYGCAGVLNSEAVHPAGYFFSIKVQPGAVGSPINLQLYDPAFIETGALCTTMPNSNGENYLSNINPYVTTAGSGKTDEQYDAYARYTQVDQVRADSRDYARRFCTGDNLSARATNADSLRETSTVTSFAVRTANDAQDPMLGAPISGCTAQFAGMYNGPTLDNLRQASATYSDATAQLFHQWYSLCTFTPQRSGDYYLQVRTNVALPSGGTTHEKFRTRSSAAWSERNKPLSRIVYRDNPAVTAPTGNTTRGEGANSFGIRAVSSHNDLVSVSGWTRMPMFQNVPTSTATFNLLRVLPAAAGQTIDFEFFDVADGASSAGSVQVVPPVTAGGTQPSPYGNCRGALNDAATTELGAGCKVTVASSTHNGQVQRMSIPIPAGYTCKDTELTGCWFRINIELNGNITDFTTWDASLEGDPVRLIE